MEHQQYWSQRYAEQNTPWDLGGASPPLTAYLQQLVHRNIKILLPGAGNAYEAEWMHKNGFSDVHVIDLAPQPLENLKKRCPSLSAEKLHLQDFFEHQGQYDLILEQTFFCALPPALRDDYAAKMSSLLKPGGQLTGLLFDFPLTADGPPFGGSREEYLERFSRDFKIHKLERCYNSIKPRMGKELFMKCIKLLVPDY